MNNADDAYGRLAKEIDLLGTGMIAGVSHILLVTMYILHIRSSSEGARPITIVYRSQKST
jgi:hypothetical protein